MTPRIIALLLAALACCAQTKQTKQDKLTLEVASVKPSPPPADGVVRVMSRGGPGTSDPTRFTAANLAMFNLVMLAYNIKPYQLTGPDWLRTQRFDVAAKVPEGASKEQFQAMLQNLLAERFKLAVHRESKEMAVYELAIGKGGPKMKESEDQSDAAPDFAPRPRPAGSPKLDKYGFPEIPAGQTPR